MSDTPSNTPSKFWLFQVLTVFGQLLTWVRRAFLNLLTFVILIALLASWLTNLAPTLPAKAPLVISPSGLLVDQFTYLSPTAQLMSADAEAQPETRVRDLVQLIDMAAQDPGINGLILKLDHLQGGGMSKMQEIGQAINRFKAQQKPVIAMADNFSQQPFFLANYADQIYMHDMGNVVLTGLGTYRNYFKTALDNLSIQFHVFKVGEFKDFVEPYTLTQMSDASRLHNQAWLDGLWNQYSEHVETHRKLAKGQLNHYINYINNLLQESQKDGAALALKFGLVDFIGSRQARRERLIEQFGTDPDDKHQLLYIDQNDYLAAHPLPSENTGNLGLIVASGEILDGDHPAGTIGGDSLAQLIRQAREDDDIKALVIRVDSPGGSAFASEIIRQEIEITQQAQKPIVISMGSIAASGGYWMSMAANQIWATPSTLTGSIGVFGLLPNINQGLNKLGVHTDGVGTHSVTAAMRPDMPLAPEAAKAIQMSVEHIYARFLSVVAQNRKSTPEDIDKIAQGRVWTGESAHRLGLIDNIGYLEDALASAAKLANLETPQIKLIERELTTEEKIMQALAGQAQMANKALFNSTDATWLRTLNGLFKNQLRVLSGLKSGTYAQCLECTEM